MRPRALLLLLALATAACGREPTSPLLQASVAGLLGEEGRTLEVGKVLTLAGEQTQIVRLQGGENGAEYLYAPFNASDNATARLVVEIQGGNVLPPTDLTNPAASLGLLPELDDGLEEDWRFHERLREREIRELGPRVGVGGAASAPGVSRAAAIPGLENPQPGDLVEINANPEDACQTPKLRKGRVVAVSNRAIVLEDIQNPSGGFTGFEYQNIAEVFDTLIYPVAVRNFGPPVYATFIQPRERVIIFYTEVVNRLTEPGSGSFVGGFFFGRDLFPKTRQDRFEACATSNQAPILYLLAPDPQGATGNVFPKDFVLRTTLSTVAHEFQHLINQSRRFFATASPAPFEEVWLNEGLSHIAEELMFYNSTPLSPRENIDIATLRATDGALQSFRTWQNSNFGRYRTYLQKPDTASLLGIDQLPTRGASWAFLRYAADLEEGPDADFFRRLVDGGEIGVKNLAEALPVNPLDLMQTWTVSNFTDDALPRVPFDLVYQQPSWNYRSIYTAALQGYPLDVIPLSKQKRVFTIRGGGAVFLRFAIPAGEVATIITTSGGAVPPDRLRLSVARLR